MTATEYVINDLHINRCIDHMNPPSQELLISDILDLLPTPDQLAALRELKGKDDVRFIWASESQIRRLGATEGAASQTIKIAETARWTIDASG
ncbi:hypothetical protein [Microbacterium esteraromaticum]|uniref:SMODS-associated NUDIX domain-containing protein n=1 Tax=Microbacterium esteraromaticum TaxID=57043 RepID=UPI003CC7F1E8